MCLDLASTRVSPATYNNNNLPCHVFKMAAWHCGYVHGLWLVVQFLYKICRMCVDGPCVINPHTVTPCMDVHVR